MSKVYKRFFDIFLSSILIIVFCPIWLILLIISMIYHLDYRVLYSDIRVFQNLKKFRTIKFRTMIHQSNKIIKMERESKKGNHFKNTNLNSELYTPFGKFLERFQLNETLQFILILYGRMSFVGNRPLPINIYESLKKNFNNIDNIFNCPSGLTGPSQVIGKHLISVDDRILIENLYSKKYISGKSTIVVDLIILFLTFKVVFFNKHTSKEYIINLLK